jgi:hypothetical protein
MRVIGMAAKERKERKRGGTTEDTEYTEKGSKMNPRF